MRFHCLIGLAKYSEQVQLVENDFSCRFNLIVVCFVSAGFEMGANDFD